MPEATETETWGHPTFRAGQRAFAVLEEYRDELTIALRVGRARQPELLRDPRFFATPYAGPQGWVSLIISGRVNWDEVAGLVLESYRTVALRRMLAALDGR